MSADRPGIVRDAISRDDVRAAVAAGVLGEGQAARLLALAESRRGLRPATAAEDESFELFRGFAEIYVTTGLVVLGLAFPALAAVTEAPAAVALAAAGLSLLLSRYFTLRRRMVLPSVYLSATFSLAVFAAAFILAGEPLSRPQTMLAVLLATLGAQLAHFRVFRVPAMLFMIGLTGLAASLTLTATLRPGIFLDFAAGDADLSALIDIGANPAVALTLLLFGLAAFAVAMRFDLRDPCRVTGDAANAFWLHILAAPAIVNVIASTLLGLGGAAGHLLAALALAAVTLVALAIDRRSFLMAGLAYFGVILAQVLRVTEIDEGWTITLALLLNGAFVTATGAWWTALRVRVMRLLPDGSLKSRLPPVAESLPEKP